LTDRRRNLFILSLVAALITLSLLIVIPGAPLAKETRLGLDLRGGVELIYQARPTPQVPEVTPQAIQDAIETIRKRTDALGVAEPEISQAGQDTISIGLPAVENAARAERQVGTTAQLQFYDWEPNIVGEDNRVLGRDAFGDPATDTPISDLYEAVQRGSKTKPVAEVDDIPPGGPDEEELREAKPPIDPSDTRAVREFYDRKNDTGQRKLYLFDKDEDLVRGPDGTCQELLQDYFDRAEDRPGGPGERSTPAKGPCAKELNELGDAGPAEDAEIIEVPRGIVLVQAERPDALPATVKFEQYFVLEDDSELSGSDIKSPEQNFDPRTNEPIVTFNFTDKGRKAFARVTKRIAQRGSETILPPGVPRDNAFQRFAITLDDTIVSRATIDFVDNPEGIDGRTGAQINGIGSITTTQDLAKNLRIGALPINLRLISKTQVSATLGQKALDEGLAASAAGLALVALFLLAFYRVLGIVAVAGLGIYALFLFALIKLIPITLTLPGIAGMVLTLAVAADANIVVFERIKEEARAGRSIPAAIAGGYGKALKTIIDANVVTVGVAFILFMLATAGVKGFAFTLGVGTLVSLFTAVLATSAVLGTFARTRVFASRHALGAGEERHIWRRFDFSGSAKWFFSMSGVILLAGALAIAGLGLQFGIDFESGTRIKTPLEQPATVDQVRATLDPLGYSDAKIQTVDEPELGQNVIQVRTTQLQPAQLERVRAALDERFGIDTGDFTSESIGPTFGAQIARTAVIAIIASLILISIYIAMRFEPKYAVPILIALAHDILITSGVYALTEREVTTSTVAALLTIFGYSLYDTIIVFDRIRENAPRMPRATFSQIVNRSMSEVLARSLATSLCTLLPVTALMLFGGETLRDFAFALGVGVLSGTYSSIFIAAPVLVEWKEREPQYRRRRRLVMEDHGGVVPPYADTLLGDDGVEHDASPEEARRARAAQRRREAAARGARPPAPQRLAGPQAPEPADGAPDGDGDGAPPPPAAEPGDGAPPPPAAEPAATSSGPSKPARNRRPAKRKHGRR